MTTKYPESDGPWGLPLHCSALNWSSPAQAGPCNPPCMTGRWSSSETWLFAINSLVFVFSECGHRPSPFRVCWAFGDQRTHHASLTLKESTVLGRNLDR